MAEPAIKGISAISSKQAAVSSPLRMAAVLWAHLSLDGSFLIFGAVERLLAESEKRSDVVFSGPDRWKMKCILKVCEEDRKNPESERISGTGLKTGPSRLSYFYISGYNVLSIKINSASDTINEMPILPYGICMIFYNKVDNSRIKKVLEFYNQGLAISS